VQNGLNVTELEHRMSAISQVLYAGATAAILATLPIPANAQGVANSPVERIVSRTVLNAISKAGVDPSVRVITTADYMVYLTGVSRNPQSIKAAGSAAAGAAPGYRVVNNITSGIGAHPSGKTGMAR